MMAAASERAVRVFGDFGVCWKLHLWLPPSSLAYCFAHTFSMIRSQSLDTKQILTDLRTELSRLDKAINALESLDSTGSTVARRGRPAADQAAPQQRRARRLTAAGRKRLSEMMKKRWAERRKKAGKPAPKQSRSRRRMSADARKKIAEAQRKRWAAKKKAAKKAMTTPAKAAAAPASS